MRGASFHLQPVIDPTAAVIHDHRAWTEDHPAPAYLLPAEHSLGHWREISGEIEATHAAKLAMASGKARAMAKGGKYSPVWEGVLNLDHPSGDADRDRQRFGQQVRRFVEGYERITGHRVIDASIHLDEGRMEAGRPVYNAHAHLVVDRTDERGRPIRLNASQLRQIQDLAAQVTGLDRGRPAEETGLKHLDPHAYRALARAGRLLDRSKSIPAEAIAVELVTRAEPGPPPERTAPLIEAVDPEHVLAEYKKPIGRRVRANIDGIFRTKTVDAVIDAAPLILEGINIGKELREPRLSRKIDELEDRLFEKDSEEYWRGHAAGLTQAAREGVQAVSRAGWVPAAQRDAAERRAKEAEERAAAAHDRHAKLLKARADKAAQADQATAAELTRLRQVERDLARSKDEIAQAKAAAEAAGRAEAARIVQEARQSAEKAARAITGAAEAEAAQRAARIDLEARQRAEKAAADILAAAEAREALAERYGLLRGLLKASGSATQADYQLAKTRRHDPPWIEERIAALEAAAEAKAAAAEQQDGRWKAAVEATTRDLLPGNTAPPALWTISRVFQHAGEAVPAAIQRKYQQARDAGRDGRG